MSEPTYRVELTHHPENSIAVQWSAEIYECADDDYSIHTSFGADMEQAFDNAQAWCRAKATEPKAPSTVLLSEYGEIVDPHEVQR